MPTLLDLVQTRVILKRKGNIWWGACPWHPEKTPSFKVQLYRGKWQYHCFSCGQHGDAIDWLQRWHNLSFREACAELGRPVKPDPTIIAARQAAERRQRAIDQYRDANPDSSCPDWLLQT